MLIIIKKNLLLIFDIFIYRDSITLGLAVRCNFSLKIGVFPLVLFYGLTVKCESAWNWKFEILVRISSWNVLLRKLTFVGFLSYHIYCIIAVHLIQLTVHTSNCTFIKRVLPFPLLTHFLFSFLKDTNASPIKLKGILKTTN